MAEHPDAGEVWSARYRRAWDRRLRGGDLAVVDLYHELLEADEGLLFLLGDDGWTQNPHYGDREYHAAEQRRLWGELGELLGIGPPPEDFLT
jgi:hypothetical protein